MADEVTGNEEIDLNTEDGSKRLQRVLAGALRATINDHGPIDGERIGSAVKRLMGQIKTFNRSQRARRLRDGYSIEARLERLEERLARVPCPVHGTRPETFCALEFGHEQPHRTSRGDPITETVGGAR